MKKSAKSSESKPQGEGLQSLTQFDSKSQTELFTSAMKAFTSGKYREAQTLFSQCAAGPQISVNESATMYGRMCQQRIERESPRLETPEDHYNFGITLINLGKFAEAKKHLETAVATSPMSHFLYALAIAEGSSGAMESAAAHLRRAIEKDPSIRGQARSDPDFHALLQDARIREVLTREPSNAA
jgi:tetratricopeptide (TPR) repeat protein